MSLDALEAYVNTAYTMLMAYNKIRRIQHTKSVRMAKKAKVANSRKVSPVR